MKWNKSRLLYYVVFALCSTILLLIPNTVQAQKTAYTDSWAEHGFNLTMQSAIGVNIAYSIQEFAFENIDINGETMKQLILPGNFLPNIEGAPDLPGSGRYIAIPQGAIATYEITSCRIERVNGVNIAPAPKIPKVSDKGPLIYNKDMKIYKRNAFYPEDPVTLSKATKIRGVDVVMLGITPYQYNPVTKELLVYRDIEIQINFEDGNNLFGDDSHRNRWFEPILSDILINYGSLSKIDFSNHSHSIRDETIDYIIITPDDPGFIAWADSLSLFRNQQGIVTRCFTTEEVGGNNTDAIEAFIDNAYYNWNLVACLLLGDEGTTGNTVACPTWSNTCLSDNIYADITNNDLPDVIMARMTADNETEVKTMVTKVIYHERFPPSNPGFYHHPITACGFWRSWWDHLCAEVVGGYFKYALGKEPVRINGIYSGTPGSSWSTANNTASVVNYFGPDGLGYIPQTPLELGGWTGGDAIMVNNAINSGAFMLLHRDHGSPSGWGVPDYDLSDIDNLTNPDLCYLVSVNCATGSFGFGEECFAEKFHRYTYNGQNAGAIGIIAASGTSWTLVNDVYTWGIYDNMWPDFMPDVNEPPIPRGLLPAFGNAGGKYFLNYSSWIPPNIGADIETFHLYHHHGGAFMTLFSEIPQQLSVVHEDFIIEAYESFAVQADSGSFIALSVGGEIIGTAEGTGSPVDIIIDPQYPPGVIDIVVTKTNHYRYKSYIHIVPFDGPFIIKDNYSFNDVSGNGNGELDYTESAYLSLDMKNVGLEDGDNVSVTVSTENPYILISTNATNYGTIPAGSSSSVVDAFAIEVADDIPDENTVVFHVKATDGTGTWNSTFATTAHAPILKFVSFTIDDSQGNANGRIDPGETIILIISVENTGTSDSYEVVGELTTGDSYIQLNSGPQEFGTVKSDTSVSRSFTITASPFTPLTHNAAFTVDFTAYAGIGTQGEFNLTVGYSPLLVIDLDDYSNPSALHILEAIKILGIEVDIAAIFPEELGKRSAIFVCLGLNTFNHILTDEQGQALADYVSNGGFLYLEGGDTWAFDPPTPVHPFFHINGTNHGSYDLGSISGKNGTFTQGLHYDYIGPNILIDYIEPEEGSGAYTIFSNDFPEYDCAIAFQGAGYRTIGSSFEFGGLTNDVYTKLELMEKYLNFFQIEKLPDAPSAPTGPLQVCQDSQDELYTTSSVEGANQYVWFSDPPEAIVQTYSPDTATFIHWNETFIGTARLYVCASNSSGIGFESESIEVMVTALPVASIWGSDTICEGDSTDFTIKCTGNGPWNVTVIDSTHQIEIVTSPYSLWVSPSESMDITIFSVVDSYGCYNVGDGIAKVIVDQIPDTPAIPSGPITVNSDEFPVSEYSITPGTNATDYLWNISPSDAGTLAMDNINCSITWTLGFSGVAQLNVQGENACGVGPSSVSLEINVENSFGVHENNTGIDFSIYPNPCSGTARLHVTRNLSRAKPRGASRVTSIDLYEITGKKIRELVHEEKMPGEYEIEIDVSDLQAGVYIFRMQVGDAAIFQKMVKL